jgi:hypothetical protein
MTTPDDVAALVAAVTELGGKTTYRAVRAHLGWEEGKFREVRIAARAEGQVGLGRGQGGTIFLLEGAQPAVEPAQPVPPDQEAAYYDRLLPIIRSGWAESEEVSDFFAEVSAHRRQRGAGRWSIPDIIFVGKQLFDFVPGFSFFVQTIEVKRFEALDELAVFEALSHRRSAHYAYLMVVNAPEHGDDYSKKISPIQAICDDQGIGLVVVQTSNEALYERWQFLVDARHNVPDPQNLNGLLARSLSPEGKVRVRNMVR